MLIISGKDGWRSLLNYSAKRENQHILTALNLVRIVEWWDETPLTKTRQSRFAALQPNLV